MESDSEKTMTIDVTGKALGRVASEVARFLQGKHRVDYQPNVFQPTTVIIKNIEQAKITGSKLTTKIYYKHTGYPGHLKKTALKEKWGKSPTELFREIVSKMLPKNKHRSEMLKQLRFE